MIRGIGVDIVEIDRFRKALDRWKGRLLDRVFSEKEREECFKERDPALHLAVRFAAKEAFSKALGTGFGSLVSPGEIEILRNIRGVPRFSISGGAKLQMEAVRVEKTFLSLSHDGGMGIAFVVLEGS